MNENQRTWLPQLQWDRSTWRGEDCLPSWNGWQARRGEYGSLSSKTPSNGSVVLSVKPVSAQDPPTDAQEAAYGFLKTNEERVHEVVASSIRRLYRRVRPFYAPFVPSLRSQWPWVRKASDLKGLVGLSKVHVLPVNWDGFAYLGFEFGCAWEEEHGLGVMIHRDRVVAAGAADMSFLKWVADEDARQRAPRPG